MGGCCSKGEKFHGLEMREEEDEEKEEEYEDDVESRLGDRGARVRLHGSCRYACMYSRQGNKGINQDAMTIWEDFNGEKGAIFCSVFDGHGQLGHRVACRVRDILPSMLSRKMKRSRPLNGDSNSQDGSDTSDDDDCDTSDDDCHVEEDDVAGEDGRHPSFPSCKTRFVKAFKDVNKELYRSTIDCFCSGCTAVSVLKQGEHLTIANLGDSRAILCTRDAKNQPIPVQLTVDLKPNVPSEAERIENCNGRIFAMNEEPEVYRIWLPDEDSPGLAMARAFGDFCLKDFGLISLPQVFYRKITEKDEFVILATDGIWDVLSNNDVVKIVSSVKKRSKAAKILVGHAIRAWEIKYPTSKVDDCAVICLYLKLAPSSKDSTTNAEHGLKHPLLSSQTLRTETSNCSCSRRAESLTADDESPEWTALDGVSRANSLLKIPRYSDGGYQRTRSHSIDEQEKEDG